MKTKNYEVYYNPIRYVSEVELKTDNVDEHKNYMHYKCPVWNHQFQRTFIVKSPVDFQFSISKENKNIITYNIDNQGFKLIDISKTKDNENSFSDENIICFPSDFLNEQPVFQLFFTAIAFWVPSDLDYVWFEFLEHPITSLKNNFIALGGWWNIASHPRNTSLAVKVIDANKPIIIKKGDPLYKVRFYTEDLNDKPILVKKDNSDEFPYEKINERMMSLRSSSKPNPEFLNTILFGKPSN